MRNDGEKEIIRENVEKFFQDEAYEFPQESSNAQHYGYIRHT